METLYKYVNGKRVEITQEEILQMQKETAIHNFLFDTTQKSSDEIIKMLFQREKIADTLSDQEALTVKAMLPTWEEVLEAGRQLMTGDRFIYQDKLVKVRKGVTPMEIYPPSIHTAADYEFINRDRAGTIVDPVPYDSNMAVERGKFYIYKDDQEAYHLYECIEDILNPLYANPYPTGLERWLKEI